MNGIRVDMSPTDRQGELAYEGLVTLARDDESVELWARIYLSGNDVSDLFSEAPLRCPEYTLVITSIRPDLEKQVWTLPPFGMRRAPAAEVYKPIRLRVPASPPWEATALWAGGVNLGGRTDEPAYWVADLRIVGPLTRSGTDGL